VSCQNVRDYGSIRCCLLSSSAAGDGGLANYGVLGFGIDGTGQTMAGWLYKLGVPVTMVLDSAVAYAMEW
jgi:hypothetical protein